MMEAATKERELSGDKAQRIVDAMRESVAKRGAAGSTFEHVAGEAGVSRGLLHYYFGTKERLLAEVVRRDCEVRKETMAGALAQARNADDVIAVSEEVLRAVWSLIGYDLPLPLPRMSVPFLPPTPARTRVPWPSPSLMHRDGVAASISA